MSFKAPGHQFDLRAAAIILREERVLLQRLEGDTFWALPGGRVQQGEAARDAVVRELCEELGEPASCGALVWVVENFFTGSGGRHHEVGLYFLVQLPSSSRLHASNGPFFGAEGAMSLEFAWFDREQLGGMDVRPSFLISALADRDFHFRHVVHRE